VASRAGLGERGMQLRCRLSSQWEAGLHLCCLLVPSTGAHACRARRGRQRRGGMARGDPDLVWAEGFKSPFRLSDIIKPPRGFGLVSNPPAAARALWAGPEPPPPPPARAARGDDAVTLPPVRARDPAGSSCLAGHRVVAGSLGPSQVAHVSGRRLLYVPSWQARVRGPY